MFTTWWSRENDQYSQQSPESLSDSIPSKLTSFRLPKCKTPPVLKNVKTKKSPKLKQKTSENSALEPDLTRGHDDTLEGQEDLMEHEREYCTVVNLRIPLPSASGFRVSRETNKLCRERTTSSGDSQEQNRRLVMPSGGRYPPESSPRLKQLELVSFANSPNLTNFLSGDLGPTCSSSCSIPSPKHQQHSLTSVLLDNQRYSINTIHRSLATSSHPHTHHPPHPPPSTRVTRPTTDYPDLLLSSKQLHTSPTCSLHGNSRAVFGYSSGHTPKRCAVCLAALRAPLLADYRLLEGDQTSHYSQSSTELPPLTLSGGSVRGGGGSGVKASSAGSKLVPLHAHGYNLLPHPLPRSRRHGRVSLTSATRRFIKEPPMCYQFPDASVSGSEAYHRRLAVMAILVAESLRRERGRAGGAAKRGRTAPGSYGSL